MRYSYALDGTSKIKDVLTDTGHLKHVIEEIARISEMRIFNVSLTNVTDEILRTGDNPKSDEGGWSAQAMGLISTSHIALHAWPDKQSFMFDLVSCRDFNSGKVHHAIVDLLAVKEIIYHATFNSNPNKFCYYTPIEVEYGLGDT
jgi:S-adenosylmethionine/arginine decarboxylase-like enzyme